jgi:BirA family biotin operon repressor/biotin-[acetyl-CoA-carboxylase] ligase
VRPLVLPPGYSPAIVERGRDPLEHARRRLVSGVEDGLLLVEDRADRLELALTLEPDRDRAGTLLVLPILAVAVADTLAAHLPPMLPVTLGWPGRVLVDGGLVGRLRLALPPGRAEDRPAWLLLGVSLDIVGPAEEPGRRPDRIGLAETGCSELDPAGLAESLSRHFLSWLDRFETEGFGPVRANWNARCHDRGRRVRLSIAGQEWLGTVGGLERDGTFRLGEARLSLEAALPELA